MTTNTASCPVDSSQVVLGLGLPADAEQTLLALTPGGYTGVASRLVDLLDV